MITTHSSSKIFLFSTLGLLAFQCCLAQYVIEYQIFRKDSADTKDVLYPMQPLTIDGPKYCAQFNAFYHPNSHFCYCYPTTNNKYTQSPTFYSINGEQPQCHTGSGQDLGCNLGTNVPAMEYSIGSTVTVNTNFNLYPVIQTVTENKVGWSVYEWSGNCWHPSIFHGLLTYTVGYKKITIGWTNKWKYFDINVNKHLRGRLFKISLTINTSNTFHINECIIIKMFGRRSINYITKYPATCSTSPFLKG